MMSIYVAWLSAEVGDLVFSPNQPKQTFKGNGYELTVERSADGLQLDVFFSSRSALLNPGSTIWITVIPEGEESSSIQPMQWIPPRRERCKAHFQVPAVGVQIRFSDNPR